MIGTTFLGGFSAALLPLGLLGSAGPAAGSYLRSYLRSPQDSGEQTALPLSRSAAPVRDLRPRPPGELEIVVASPVSELVIVDSAVQDRAVLQRALRPGVQMVEIDASRPGLPQLVQALASFKNLSAIHVVSHAEAGVLLLGSSRITAESIKGEIESLAALRNAVRPGGDLLFYGCDLAATPEGEQLLDIVQHATQLDMAASSNATGNLAQGGDWQLEVRRGHVDTQLAFSDKALADFSGVLQAANGTYGFVPVTNWSGDKTPELTSAHFKLTARDGDDAIRKLYMYAGAVGMMDGTYTGNAMRLRANAPNTTLFELTAVNTGEALIPGGGGMQYADLTNVRIEGLRADGVSTIVTAPKDGTGSADSFNFSGADLSAFQNKRFQSFRLLFDCKPPGSSQCAAYMELRNFTVQNAVNTPLPLPVVTDANIGLSGASSLLGAFKAGDTVTVTWNNTGAGDNVSEENGVNGVTVDFSQFGGPAAAPATNNGSGIWTAAYVLAAGYQGTNRNVSVTATNGNGSTTTADTANATVDTLVPAVSSIAFKGSPAPGDASMEFTVTFNKQVSNVFASDFALASTGSASGTIASVFTASGISFDVNITGITGNGTLKLNLSGANGISDSVGNASPAAFSAGATHTVAVPVAPSAPTVASASPGNGQATVTFGAPASNGGTAIATYTAVASGVGGQTGSCPGPAACTITVPGLTNGISYSFNVSATNSAGLTGPAATSNNVTPQSTQTISFTPAASYNFGTTPTLTATSSAGGSYPVSFTSTTTGVCTIASTGTLTFVTAGSCTINADQPGDAATSAAPQVGQTFNVNAIAPGAPTIGTATAGDAQAAVSFTAPASTGGAAVTYTATSSPGSFTATGSSPITVPGLINGTAYTFSVTAANSAGPGSPSAASNAVTPKASQTISFTPAASYNFGTTPTLTATSSAGGSYPVSFTSTTTGVCTITPTGTLTFVTAGSCTINANQPGDAATSAAPQVGQTFNVNAIAPGAPTIGTATAGDAQATVSFTAPASTGGAAVTYTATSSPGSFTATGSSPITVPGLINGTAYTFSVTAANSAGPGSPSAASNAVTPKASQTISFTPAASYNFGTTPTLTATSSAGGSYPVSFTSTTTGVCTITPTGTLTFVTAGSCTINANQPGNAATSAAPQVSQTFNVNAIAPDVPVIGTVTTADAQATVNFTASAGSGGAPITGYTVTATPLVVPGAPAVTTQTGTASPIVVTGLANGFAYSFTVKATNGAQTSADSAAVQGTPRKLELVGAPGSVPGMSGTPTATLSGGGSTCTLQASGGFGPAAATPPGLQAPNGQFAFTAEQCTGAVTMTLVYPSPLPLGVQFRKPDGAGGWFDPMNAATSLNVHMNPARTTISYTITDNGLGDTNPATGSVSDPFVPVVAAVAPGGAQAIPSLGGWALAMLSGLLGGLALRSRKVFTARR
ncbi:DUF4347 domain-containing protein [Delftia acidovorans]|uniref:DUF4347 domain-containing protein n=1 Tax=Delftia acidovorans TaxID=80866 RepID=A0A7T2S6J3_DELAC|nr:DUF4347 domain-containing protein [Delftia acidovorans]QPS09804.1 DUF4347 domain-containing protein [Delftia acidovorans]